MARSTGDPTGEDERRRLAPRDLAKFTAVVALLAIFFDAAIGHGLAWENDLYWTYWITKTFLIATVFGLGTAWLGIGIVRGAVITAVHTLVLTIYYWSFSPIGLPSSPEWLDLEHTWLSGLPIHFGVIYLGYLVSLWIWRRARAGAPERADTTGSFAVRALLVGLILVVVAGGIASLALGEFPGVTWFLVRVLITIPFLLAWWGVAGRDVIGSVVGALILALIWATYAQFLGPSGLPDMSIRILDADPPPATSRWLDYKELWLISLPIYIITTVGILLMAARRRARGGMATPTLAAAALAAVMLTGGFTISPDHRGEDGALSTSGTVEVETGDWYSDVFTSGTGDIEVRATDMGDRVSPLPPHDEVSITASVRAEGRTYELTVDRPIVSDPLGEHTTWWGVGFDVSHHGRSGIGSDHLPPVGSDLAAFGLGTLTVDGGDPIPVPVHVMTSDGVFPGDADLELDVGDHRLAPLPGIPNGHLRVLWSGYEGEFSRSTPATRYLIGAPVLGLMLFGALWLNRREVARTDR